jgi:hypothetical protein
LPVTRLNIFVIDGNTEADRQTPMWGRGRIDQFDLAAASPEAFETIRGRPVEAGTSDGTVNDFGTAQSSFFAIRTVSRAKSCCKSRDGRSKRAFVVGCMGRVTH